jgi:hypothetical protein
MGDLRPDIETPRAFSCMGLVDTDDTKRANTSMNEQNQIILTSHVLGGLEGSETIARLQVDCVPLYITASVRQCSVRDYFHAGRH